MYAGPSKTVRRKIREPPWDEPQSWPGAYWSMPMTEVLRWLACHRLIAPMAPRPTTAIWQWESDMGGDRNISRGTERTQRGLT